MTAAELAHALGAKRSGRQWVCKCVAHDDAKASMIIFDGREEVQVRCLAGCRQDDLIGALIDRGLWGDDVRKSAQKCATADNRDRSELARWLWSQRQPMAGTLAERYLREQRGIACPLPATLMFLPPRGQHPAAMIAAFALADEIEPGVLQVLHHRVQAVHLTKLTPEARKIEKIIVGSPRGAPVVLAPPNDLMGLAICEGIEDALTVHQLTGLGAWAAGSASLLPSLVDAVPDYIDCVTLFADPNEAGERHCSSLMRALQARSIHVEITSSSGVFR